MEKGVASCIPPVNKLPEDEETENRSYSRDSCFSQWLGGQKQKTSRSHTRSKGYDASLWVGGNCFNTLKFDW